MPKRALGPAGAGCSDFGPCAQAGRAGAGDNRAHNCFDSRTNAHANYMTAKRIHLKRWHLRIGAWPHISLRVC